MKRIKIAGLCLVAVFAFSAVAAGSASAANPKFETCVKTPKVGKKYPTGEYSNKTCTEAASEGKYKLAEVAPGTKFTGKSKAATFTVDGKVIKCKKDTSSGEILESEAAIETITFSDCAVNGNKKEPCETEGAGAGTIKTETLFVVPRYINAANTEFGAALINLTGPFVVFKCGSETITLEGGPIGSVENTKKGIAITLEVNGSGEQAHKDIWEGASETGPLNLFTEPGAHEATLVTTEEQGPKGVGLF